MLKIYFGEMKGEIYNPPLYFANQYEDEWITSQLSKEMILDVDRSEVVSAHVIESPVLGAITPLHLSDGVKTLILMAHDNTGRFFNASAGGDNCAKWIYEISKQKDLIINLHHIMDFSTCDNFSAYIINTDKQVNSYKEYLDEAFRIEER